MKALVGCIQDIADPNSQMHFEQYPLLRTKLSLGGYTSAAVELDKDIFDSAILPKSLSKQTYVDMSLNFGTEESKNMFPSLPAITTTNSWK